MLKSADNKRKSRRQKTPLSDLNITIRSTSNEALLGRRAAVQCQTPD